jgi:Transcriptional regulators
MNELGETANATEMAKLLDKNTNTISTLLDRMERNGLVKKVRDTQDRRMVFAIMTPKGQKRLAVSIKASSVIFEKLAEGLSKEEMYEFNTLLEKLMKNTDKLVNPPKIVKIRKSY